MVVRLFTADGASIEALVSTQQAAPGIIILEGRYFYLQSGRYVEATPVESRRNI